VPCDRYSRPKQFPDRSIKTRSQMSMPAIGTPITQSSEGQRRKARSRLVLAKESASERAKYRARFELSFTELEFFGLRLPPEEPRLLAVPARGRIIGF